MKIIREGSLIRYGELGVCVVRIIHDLGTIDVESVTLRGRWFRITGLPGITRPITGRA